METKKISFVNKNIKSSIGKIVSDLKKKKIERFCFHKEFSQNGQFMIINRKKGMSFTGITNAYSSLWLIIKGEMIFQYKNTKFLLKKNDLILLKKKVSYKNFAKKNTIIIEFKSSYNFK